VTTRVAADAPPKSHNSIHNRLTAVEFVRPVPAVVVSVAQTPGRQTHARVATLKLIHGTRYTHTHTCVCHMCIKIPTYLLAADRHLHVSHASIVLCAETMSEVWSLRVGGLTHSSLFFPPLPSPSH